MCKLFALFHILIFILNFSLPFFLFGLKMLVFFSLFFLVWFVYLFSSYLLYKKLLYNTHYVECAYNIISMTDVQHKLIMKAFFYIYNFIICCRNPWASNLHPIQGFFIVPTNGITLQIQNMKNICYTYSLTVEILKY